MRARVLAWLEALERWWVATFQRCRCPEAVGYGKHAKCGKFHERWMKP